MVKLDPARKGKKQKIIISRDWEKRGEKV